MAHKTTLHTGYHSDILQVWKAAVMRTKCRVDKCSLVRQLPEVRKSFGGGKGKPSSCTALLRMCSFAAIKPG